MTASVSQSTRIKALMAGLIMAVALTVPSASVSAANVTFSSARDCDTNAIMRCGAMDIDELQRKYNADAKAQSVYGAYGITRATVENMKNTTVAGSVTKSGNVEVNGKVVATGATSAGYHNMRGSTRQVAGGVTYYDSAPSTSFVANRIDAYVVLNEHKQFVAAVLASCGNPVKAKNVVPKPEQPKPEQPKPEQPKPVQPKPVKETPAPQAPAAPTVVQPAAAQTPAPAPVLVEVGAGSVAGLFAGVSVLGAAGHAIFTRFRNRG